MQHLLLLCFVVETPSLMHAGFLVALAICGHLFRSRTEPPPCRAAAATCGMYRCRLRGEHHPVEDGGSHFTNRDVSSMHVSPIELRGSCLPQSNVCLIGFLCLCSQLKKIAGRDVFYPFSPVPAEVVKGVLADVCFQGVDVPDRAGGLTSGHTTLDQFTVDFLDMCPDGRRLPLSLRLGLVGI